ncbi:MAG: ribosome maturation factor RimM [Gemmatimonadota bacterium]
MPAPGAPGNPPEHLIVGHIAKAHGTRGELFVWPLTDHPDDVFATGQQLLLGDEEGALPGDAPFVVVETARAFKRGLLVRLEGITSREESDAVARRYLLVPADAVAPADEDELFYHELLGMRVVTVAGGDIGVVREVYEAVPHDLLEVKGVDGRVRLIPFADRLVHEIDRDNARLVIDPPEGLLDL